MRGSYRDGEMAQQPRECTSLVEDLSLALSIHTRRLITSFNSSSRESDAQSGSGNICSHKFNPHTQTHHIQIIKNKINPLKGHAQE